MSESTFEGGRSPSPSTSPSTSLHEDKMRSMELGKLGLQDSFFSPPIDHDTFEENASTCSEGDHSNRSRGQTIDSRVDFEQLAADLNEANPYTSSEAINYIMVKEIKSAGGSNHDDRVNDRKVTTRQLFNDYIDYIKKIDKDLKESSSMQSDHARQVKIHELRKLEFELNPHEERSILIRRHCVLVALDPIRAMITAEKLILFIAPGADGYAFL